MLFFLNQIVNFFFLYEYYIIKIKKNQKRGYFSLFCGLEKDFFLIPYRNYTIFFKESQKKLRENRSSPRYLSITTIVILFCFKLVHGCFIYNTTFGIFFDRFETVNAETNYFCNDGSNERH